MGGLTILGGTMSQSTADTGGTYQIDDGEQLSSGVVHAVADAEDADPLDLTPLYGAVDPDALDALFASLTDDSEASVDEVTFDYHGYDVTVTADGVVRIE